MNKRFQKIAALSCATALTLSLLTPSALANGNGKDNGEDKGSTGAGQTAVHIHGVKDIADNKDEVTITVGDKSYTGVLKGDKLTIEMGSTDNGFDFGKDESLEIGYKTANGSGTILIKHQEGNGANIGTEHDKGLNNFKGEVKPNPVPSTQPSAEPSAEPSAQPSAEPSAQPSAEPCCAKHILAVGNIHIPKMLAVFLHAGLLQKAARILFFRDGGLLRRGLTGAQD